MPDLAIDRAIAAVRTEIDGRVWWEIPSDIARLAGLRAALAILKAAQACDAAWGTRGLYAAQQALHAAIRGES